MNYNTLFAATVTVTWDANTEPDLKGYNIYRKCDGTALPTITVGKVTSYRDTAIPDTCKNLDVYLTAFDLTGNESSGSKIISKTLVVNPSPIGGVTPPAPTPVPPAPAPLPTPPPPVVPPTPVVGVLNDFNVVTIKDTEVTVEFTDVDDGTGTPANLDIRVGSPYVGWGVSTSATLGTCKSPVIGVRVGQKRNCTIQGLKPDTDNGVQAVPFAGQMNTSTVRYGALINPIMFHTLKSVVVSPPPVQPSNAFTNVTQDADSITMNYSAKRCPKGISRSSGSTRTDTRTITLTCVK